MFEILAGFGDTEKGIELATSLGTPIKNLVELDPPPAFVSIRYQDFLKSYGQQWVPRKPVTGRYNCAGHVWASRRTTILEVAEYHKIIQEDGYRRISQNEWVMPDDIAVYEDGDQAGEIMHVARVYKLEPGLTPTTPIPWIVSKWNSTYGECLHSVYDVPFGKNFPNIVIYFLTDRPFRKNSP